MDAAVQTTRRYETVEATISGEGGPALAAEVTRALSEVRGRKVTVSIRVENEAGGLPAESWRL